MLIPASETARWREALSRIGDVDASYLPEYHQAYSLRIADSAPYLWHYAEGGEDFLYPFLLTPVAGTGFYDISGIYGYTGPLATSESPAFIAAAWNAFDAFAKEKHIIAEFIRFSPYHQNERFAPPGATVEANRTLAVSHLPQSEEELLQKLGSKTRNMLRKAERAGLVAKELALPQQLPAFRTLYDDTMRRNQAPRFFHYDDAYYQYLLQLKDGLRLFGVFAGEQLVAAAMAVVGGKAALYHLGASLPEFSSQGAGNLSIFHMSRCLMQSGCSFINMTGGRTTAADDPLLLFKKSNATGTATFYIGKRILDAAAYADVRRDWEKTHDAPGDGRIIFWRD